MSSSPEEMHQAIAFMMESRSHFSSSRLSNAIFYPGSDAFAFVIVKVLVISGNT